MSKFEYGYSFMIRKRMCVAENTRALAPAREYKTSLKISTNYYKKRIRIKKKSFNFVL
jgi:hypothetical protein